MEQKQRFLSQCLNNELEKALLLIRNVYDLYQTGSMCNQSVLINWRECCNRNGTNTDALSSSMNTAIEYGFI
jgi:hypothetical protein